MVFKGTGKSPSVPTATEISAGLTHQYRGISKYAMARKCSTVRDPVALLFGQEYARAKGNGLNEADVDRGIIAALHIRQAGGWAADIALVGKSPTNEELDALPKSIETVGNRELLNPEGAMVQGGNGCDERILATQMFDPPITGRTMIVGCPVLRIPNSEKKYPNFLDWWASVGRLNPRDAQGWSTLSGPGVMKDRTEIINPDEWAALPEEERVLITSWVRTWPIGMFFD
jgi:hypothetical protein